MKQGKKVVSQPKKTVVLSYWRCNPNDNLDRDVKLWNSNGWHATFWNLSKSQAKKRYKSYMALIGRPVPRRVKLEVE